VGLRGGDRESAPLPEIYIAIQGVKRDYFTAVQALFSGKSYAATAAEIRSRRQPWLCDSAWPGCR